MTLAERPDSSQASPTQTHSRELLLRAAGHAERFFDSLETAPVDARTRDAGVLRELVGGPMPREPTPALTVLDDLFDAATLGAVRTQSPRYFGFVQGGTLPAALAADWLTSALDQNAISQLGSPLTSVLHQVVGDWVKELLGLPADASFAIVSGTQMGHVTCLAAARHHVLAARGWDVEARGLHGAPPVRILAGADRHPSIDRAVRLLGFGRDAITTIPSDDQGRMRPAALASALAEDDTATIVCAQCGELHTGDSDPFVPITEAARAAGAWVHVDGAFALWARASPVRAGLFEGLELADSWATDAHKWLNTPYDCGLLFTRHPAAHRAAFGFDAPYLAAADRGHRDEWDWSPDLSRRARVIPLFAALRSLGREGLVELVERSCACARRFADALGAVPGLEILNEVVLNQVTVGFARELGPPAAIAEAVQRDGTCWVGASTWHGRPVMRISVCHWATCFDDVDRSVAAITAAVMAVGQAGRRDATATRRRGPLRRGPMVRPAEKVVLVDDDDTPIGSASAHDAHRHGLLYQAFSMFAFNEDGDLLLPQRSARQPHSGGRWSASCSGHPRPGEPTAVAVRRHCRAELGTARWELQHVGVVRYRVPVGGLVEHHSDHLYVAGARGLPRPDPRAVGAWQYLDPELLTSWVALRPDDFTPWLPPTWEHVVQYRTRQR